MRKILVGLFAALIMVFGIYGYSAENNQVEIMDEPQPSNTEEVSY